MGVWISERGLGETAIDVQCCFGKRERGCFDDGQYSEITSGKVATSEGHVVLRKHGMPARR